MIQLGRVGGPRRVMQGTPNGGATSSTNVRARVGVPMRPGAVFVPREGWVRWAELSRQVNAAFQAWRMRKALQGIKIVDGAELIQADVAEAVARRKGRAA